MTKSVKRLKNVQVLKFAYKIYFKTQKNFIQKTDYINKQLQQVYIGQFHCSQLKLFCKRTICSIIVQMKLWNRVAVKTASIKAQKSV
jgi:hypothetical protein